jgi:hypothetical protein
MFIYSNAAARISILDYIGRRCCGGGFFKPVWSLSIGFRFVPHHRRNRNLDFIYPSQV